MPRLLALLLLFTLTSATTAGAKVEIIAHRGASYEAPENTLAAIKLAWAQKAAAAEFDVHLTKDRRIVVIHDKDTKRVAGVDKKIANSTLAEIRMLDVGKWKGTQFAGQKIPTLKEMLATVPAGKRVFVEVKTGPDIVPELDRELRASGLRPEQTPIISFNAQVVAEVKRVRPDLFAYWVVSMKAAKGKEVPTAEALITRAKGMHADGLDLSVTPALDKAFADKVRAAGLKLYVWTVNDISVARRMVEIRVDGITTDRPGWLLQHLEK
jgi:glycerophosphoryl diester phosphodiesterase